MKHTLVRAQMLYIPITPIIQAYYSVAETSEEMLVNFIIA